jgi:hypothetical protein
MLEPLQKMYEYQKDRKEKFSPTESKYHPLNEGSIRSCMYLLKALDGMIKLWAVSPVLSASNEMPKTPVKSGKSGNSNNPSWFKSPFSPKSNASSNVKEPTSTSSVSVSPTPSQNEITAESFYNELFYMFMECSGSTDLTSNFAQFLKCSVIVFEDQGVRDPDAIAIFLAAAKKSHDSLRSFGTY